MKNLFIPNHAAETTGKKVVSITFRLNSEHKAELEAVAEGKGMLFTTLVRVWVLERLKEEREKAGQKAA